MVPHPASYDSVSTSLVLTRLAWRVVNSPWMRNSGSSLRPGLGLGLGLGMPPRPRLGGGMVGVESTVKQRLLSPLPASHHPDLPSPAAAELAAAKAAAVASFAATELIRASIESLVSRLEAERARLSTAKVVSARDAKRVKEAERWVVTEAERAHSAEQPIVLQLPDVLQKKIIDLLPTGR